MSETELVTMQLNEYSALWLVLGFFLGAIVGFLSTFIAVGRKNKC